MNYTYITTKTLTQKKFFISNELLFSTIAMMWALNFFIAETLNVYELGSVTYLFYIVIYSFGFLAWGRALFKKPCLVIPLLMGISMVLLLSFMFNQHVIDVFFNFGSGGIGEIAQSNFAILFGLCLPLVLLSQLRMDFGCLTRYLYRYSIINILLFSFTMFIQIFIMPQTINYMTLAYAAIPSIFIAVAYGYIHKLKVPIILSLVGMFFMLLGGSRGAILTLAIFIFFVLMYYFKSNKNTKKFIILLLLLIITIFIAIYFYEIIQYLCDWLEGFGYSSRLIEKILDQSMDGNIFEFSDRAEILENSIEHIGTFGKGVYGDWVINGGVYSHNFIIEILVQYGIVLGALILLLFVLFLIYTVKKSFRQKNSFLRFMQFAFFAVLLGKMMVSSSYLIDQAFWLFISMMCLIYNKRICVIGEN
ncbi:MAG: hypothetical protein DBX97_03070 [Collinsella tanakaei]|nr:MAG: hypothetical protein DBX97_03070 [Collinsella tanakaei]